MTSKRNTTTVLFQAIRMTAVLAVVAALFWGNSLSAAVIDWTLAGSGTWSTGGNWTPAGPPVASSNVQFGTLDIGFVNTVDTGGVVIDTYEIGPNNNSGLHTTALGSNSLTTTDMFLAVGFGARANLAVTGGVGSSLNVNGDLVLARGRAPQSTVTLDPDVVLNLGIDASNRGRLFLGDNTNASHDSTQGTLNVGTEINFWLSKMVVGQKFSGATVGEAGTNLGRLDLSGVTTGVLDISGDVFVGDGHGTVGELTVPASLDLKIGVDASTRGTLHIASGGGKEPGVSDTSFVTLDTGLFNAFLTELNVGTVNKLFRLSAGTANKSTDANGTLDLSSVSGGLLDVDGTVSIGVMTGTQPIPPPTSQTINSALAVGTVLFPSTISASATDLVIGSNPVVLGTGEGIGHGLLVLDGTTFDISGNVTLEGGTGTDEQSIIRTIISGESAGLSLSNTSLLTVDNAQLELIFNGPNPDAFAPYWGLRWDGDHVADLVGLGSSLMIDDSGIGGGVSIFLLGGVTYVGVAPAPEPSSLMLLGLGMLGLARYGRRRSRRRGV